MAKSNTGRTGKSTSETRGTMCGFWEKALRIMLSLVLVVGLVPVVAWTTRDEAIAQTSADQSSTGALGETTESQSADASDGAGETDSADSGESFSSSPSSASSMDETDADADENADTLGSDDSAEVDLAATLESTAELSAVPEGYEYLFTPKSGTKVNWKRIDDTLYIVGYDDLQGYEYYSWGWRSHIGGHEQLTYWESMATEIQVISLSATQKVTSLPNGIFSKMANVKAIYLPDSITSIGEGAFYGCSNLEKVEWQAPKGFSAGITYYSIGTEAFAYCTSLRQFDLTQWTGTPQIKKIVANSIGDSAFRGSGVKSLTIPGEVTTLGSYVFADTPNLAVIEFTGALPTTFGRSLLADVGHDVKLTYYSNHVTDKGQVQALSKSMSEGFSHLLLWTDLAGKIEQGASGSCGDTLSWTLEEGTLTITGHGAMNDYSITGGPWRNFAASMGATLNVKNVVFVNDGEGPITTIGANAFGEMKSIQSVTLPDGLTVIGEMAFMNCTSLSKINLPDSLEKIGQQAFLGDSALTLASPILPTSLTCISASAFNGCKSITELTVLDRVNVLGDNAFANSGLKKISFQCAPATYGTKQFDGLSNVTAYVAAGVADTWTQKVRDYFGGTNIKWEISRADSCGDKLSWSYSEGTLTITGQGDMYNFNGYRDAPWKDYVSYIKQVVFVGDGENPITGIGAAAFRRCTNLEAIELPEGLVRIGAQAFEGCTALTSIEFPSTFNKLEKEAFKDCTGIKRIDFLGAAPADIEDFSSFKNVNNVLAFYRFEYEASWATKLPQALISNENTTWTWGVIAKGKLSDTISWELKDNILTISGSGDMPDFVGEGAGAAPWHSMRDKILGVVFADAGQGGLTKVGAWAFHSCVSLTSITWSGSIKAIGDNAFSSCRSLSSVTLPSSVTNMGEGVFRECARLASVDLSSTSVQTIGSYCFQYCTVLTSVKLPNGLKSIESGAFGTCESLSQIALPDSLVTLGYGAFRQTGLVNVTVPASVTTFENEVFVDCGKLQSLTIQCAPPLGAGISCFKGVVGYRNASAPSNPITVAYPKARANLWTVAVKKAFVGTNARVSWSIDESQNSCGTDLMWSIDSSTRTLIIVGSGSMSDFDPASAGSSATNTAPWLARKADFDKVVFREAGGAITSVGSYAFQDTNVASVTWPAGLQKISEGAFMGCASLTAASLPINVQEIGKNAFRNCVKLETVNLPNGLKSIGYTAFNSCSSIKTVTIPATVSVFESYVFEYCSAMTSIHFKGCPQTLGYFQLGYCGNEGGQIDAYVTSDAGWTETKCTQVASGSRATVTWRYESDQKCGDNLFWTLDSSGVLTITGYGEMYGFDYNEGYVKKGAGRSVPWKLLASSITEVRLVDKGGSIKNIGSYAFGVDFDTKSPYTRLTTVDCTQATNLSEIGNYAFKRCTQLTTVKLPDSVTSIGVGAFAECAKLTGVKLPASLQQIENEAFKGCTVLTCLNEQMKMPDSVTLIRDYAFEGCSALNFSSLSSGLSEVNDSTFKGCTSLALTELPSGIQKLYSYAFSGCTSLALKALPEEMREIGSLAFEGCSKLEIAVIQEKVSRIGYRAFMGCTSLGGASHSLTFMHTQNEPSIDTEAFYGCKGIEEVTTFMFLFTGLNGGIFSNLNRLTMHVPTPPTQAALDKAKQNVGFAYTVWDIGSSGVCGDHLRWALSGSKLTIAGYGAMYDYKHDSTAPQPWAELKLRISEVVFEPTSGLAITNVGDYAFYQCAHLQSVTLPDTIERIGMSAFEMPSSQSIPLVTVRTPGSSQNCLPSSLTSIGSNAFSKCSNLDFAELPSGITTIGVGAFSGCSKLSLTVLPEGLSAIADKTFVGCSSLKLGSLPSKITSIGDHAFASCGVLALTELPDSVSAIGAYAFSDCTNLALAALPQKLTKIQEGTFKNCLSLAFTELPAGLTGIFTGAFENCPKLAVSELPESLTRIGNRAFKLCTSIGVTMIPDKVTYIGSEAFCGCTQLSKVNMPYYLGSMGAGAFSGGGTINIYFVTNPPTNSTGGSTCSGSFAPLEGAAVTMVNAYYPRSCELKWTPIIRATYSNLNNVTWQSYDDSVDISTADIALDPSSFVYDGTEKKPAVTVKYQGTLLNEGTDYTVRYENNVNAGQAEVVVRGRSKFSGEVRKQFTITPCPLERATVSISKSESYTGAEQTFAVGVSLGDTVLERGRDYTVSGNTAKNAGSYTATVTAVPGGNYTGSLAADYSIAPVQCTVRVHETKAYDGTPLAYTLEALDVLGLKGSDTLGGTISTLSAQAGSYTYAGMLDGASERFNLSLNWGDGTIAGNYVVYVDAGITIQCLAVEITIAGNNEKTSYDGTVQTRTGFKITSIGSPLLDVSKVQMASDQGRASGVDVGTYPMGLTAKSFFCDDTNFQCTFKVTDGSLTIEPRELKVSVSASKYFDDKVFTLSSTDDPASTDVTGGVTIAGLAEGDAAVATFTTSGSAAGTYTVGATTGNIATPTLSFTHGKEGNYAVAYSGEMMIIEQAAKAPLIAVVGLYPYSPVPYTGAEQTQSGYLAYKITMDSPAEDVTAKVRLKEGASATATGTNPGTYYMGLTSASFTYDDFPDAIFVVSDGYLQISRATLLDKDVTVGQSLVYNGNLQHPTITVSHDGRALVEGKDYELSHAAVSDAGTYSCTITGIGNYQGSVQKEWTVAPAPAKVTVHDSKAYDGRVIEHAIEAAEVSGLCGSDTLGGTLSSTSTHAATYSFSDGTVGVDLAWGEGTRSTNYTVSVDAELVIDKAEFEVRIDGMRQTVKRDGAEHSVSGFAAALTKVVKGDQGTFDPAWVTLKEGKQAVASGTEIDTYSMGLVADDFVYNDPSVDVVFAVNDGWLEIKPDVTTCTVSVDSSNCIYNGSMLSPKVTVTCDSKTLVEGQDYSIVGNVAKAAGTYTLTVTGMGAYSGIGSRTAEWIIAKAQIAIEVSGAQASAIYDGQQHKASGFEVKCTTTGASFFASSNVAYSGTVEVAQADAGTYPMGLDAAKFTYSDPSVEATFAVKTDGSLSIAKARATVQVGASKAYDGSVFAYSLAEADVSGMVPGQTLGGTLSTKETDSLTGASAGDYSYYGVYGQGADERSDKGVDFTPVWGGGAKADNYEVFVSAALSIARAQLEVTVTGRTPSATYDGKQHEASGYNATCTAGATSLFDASKVKLVEGMTDTVRGTDAGTYYMGLTSASFAYGDANIECTFKVTDGSLTIDPRALGDVSLTGTKVYDKAVLETSRAAMGLVDGQTLTVKARTNAAAAGPYSTQAGTATIEYIWGNGAKARNYTVNVTATLTINKAQLAVKVVGATKSVKYDGKQHEVSGYRTTAESGATSLFEASKVRLAQGATAHAVGTNVGTYPMGLTNKSFIYNDNNIDCTFVVTDGVLTITSEGAADFTVSAEPLNFIYNGREQGPTNIVVKQGDTTLVEGTDYELEGAVGTAAGTYLLAVIGINNYEGSLFIQEWTISKADMTVSVIGGSYEGIYDGQQHAVRGYELGVTQESTQGLFDASKVTYAGEEPVAVRTDAGTSYMGLAAGVFSYNDDNIDCTFAVTDGKVDIKPASLYIVVQDSKVYDTTVLTRELKATEIAGLVPGETFTGTVSTTEAAVGGYDYLDFTVELTGSWGGGAKADNYDLIVDAWLSIEPAQIDISVTGRSATLVYNAAEQTVSGIDISCTTSGCTFFDPDKVVIPSGMIFQASGIEAGVYTMEVDVSQFTYSDTSATPRFYAQNGTLTITQAPLQVVAFAAKSFDGKPLSVNTADDTAKAALDGLCGTDAAVATVATIGTEEGVYSSKDGTVTTSVEFSSGRLENYSVNTNAEFAIAEPEDRTLYIDVFGNHSDAPLDYTGQVQSIQGYTAVKAGGPDDIEFDIGKLVYTGEGTMDLAQLLAGGNGSEPKVSGTNPGTYYMGLDSSKFTYNDEAVGEDYVINVADGYLQIAEYATVTFESNGGSAVPTQNVTIGKSALKPVDPTRDGFAFGGWFADAKCISAFDFSTSITKDTTVYAKWTENGGGAQGDGSKSTIARTGDAGLYVVGMLAAVAAAAVLAIIGYRRRLD